MLRRKIAAKQTIPGEIPEDDIYRLRAIFGEENVKLTQKKLDEAEKEKIRNTYNEEIDSNDRIVYYRACVINHLERACVKIFVENEEQILSGTFEGSLIDQLPDPLGKAYRNCAKMARERIYNCKEVSFPKF